jgi:hypothetical protein
MKKTNFFGIAGIAIATMLLVGCAEQPPTDNSTIEPAMIAEPGTKFPLNPIDNQEALKYCPYIEAVPFDESGISLRTKDIKTIYVCKNDLVADAASSEVSGSTTHVYQVSSGVEDLLKEYSHPSENIQPDLMCPAMLADPLIIWVTTGAATPVAIYAPVTQCGFPLDSAADLYNNLSLTEIPSSTVNTIID